jgi:hypothetical protein
LENHADSWMVRLVVCQSGGGIHEFSDSQFGKFPNFG